MANCCNISPPMAVPATMKWATLVGFTFFPNRCPCPGGCKVDLVPKPNWQGWSGTLATPDAYNSPPTPPNTITFKVDISCKSISGDGYFLTVESDNNCGGLSDYRLTGGCNTALGQTAWVPTGAGCCGFTPGGGIAVVVTDSEPAIPPFVPPPWPPCPLPPCQCDGPWSGPTCTTTCPPSLSSKPIRYATGEISLKFSDLQSDGFGLSWGHTRTFSNRLSVNRNPGNGYNWFLKEWSYLQRTSIPGKTNPYLAVMGDATSTWWFEDLGNDTFRAAFNDTSTLRLDRSRERFLLSLPDGSTTEFDQCSGLFARRVLPGGQVLEVTSRAAGNTKIATVERSYTNAGQTTTEQFLYTWTQPYDQLLESVTLRRKVNAGSWENVQRVNFTYYVFRETNGAWGDLKTATTQSWSGGTWADTGTSYYRYYKTLASSSSTSSSSSSSSSGSSSPSYWPDEPAGVHLLKYVLEPAAFERLKADPSVTDPFTASDAIVSLYADYYFEYDDQQRVTRERVESGSRTFTFSYSQSAFADGENSWKFKTIETLPDGNRNIIFANHAGRTMLSVFESGSARWCDFYKWSDGQVIWHAQPSAVSGYDETKADLLNLVGGNYQYLRDNDGLLNITTHDTATGWMTSESVQQGELGTPIQVREWEYISCCSGSSSPSSSSSSSSSSSAACANPVYLVSKRTEYPSDTIQTKKLVTSNAYTFYSGMCAVQQKTTTLPLVSAAQNGSGVAATRKEYFDQYGNMTWSMDERGFITRLKYDIPTGAMTQRIDDVDTSVETDAPTGWTTPSGGGLNLKTDFESDSQGRITQVLAPSHAVDLSGVPGGSGSATTIRRATWTVYKESSTGMETWTGQGYQKVSDSSYTLINPVSITKMDLGGRVTEQIQATRASTSGKLTSSDSFAQSSYVRWTTTQYTDCCFAASQRMYHTILASGSGSSGTNYDETDYGYSVMKRQNRVVTPGGTITDTVYDTRGQVIGTYVGTNDDGGTEDDPTGGGSDPDNNMVLVTANVFDNGLAGYDGNLTKVTQYVSGSDTRVTNMCYDWRDRRDGTDGEIDFYEQTYYDNLDRVIKTERYDTIGPCTPSSSSSSSSSGSTLGKLIARSETKFDDRGRVYRTVRYAVDVTTGVVGNSLTDNSWVDAAGNVIKQLPAGSSLFTKTEYDSLNRPSIRYSGYDLDETGYPG